MKLILSLALLLSFGFFTSCSSNKKKGTVGTDPTVGVNQQNGSLDNATGQAGQTGNVPPLYGSSPGDQIPDGAINAGTLNNGNINSGSYDSGSYNANNTVSSDSSDYGNFPLQVNGSSDDLNAGGLASVYFSFNSSLVNGSASNLLQDNIRYLRDNPNVSVQLEGHCDERGSIQYNLALGERRANSIRDFLVSQGISSSRISTISYGKERPLDYAQDESAWAKNRRVNFVVTSK